MTLVDSYFDGVFAAKDGAKRIPPADADPKEWLEGYDDVMRRPEHARKKAA